MSEESNDLSRRERQIMETLYRLGKASAIEIRDAMPTPPTYTAVRTHLAILQDKGLIRYDRLGAKHIYEPVVPREEMAKNVISNVIDNFFGGSVERVVATLIEPGSGTLSEDQLDRLSKLIEKAKEQGR
jgi:predicted transcriptional regulator